MDVLSDVLRTMGVNGAVLSRPRARAPWGLHFTARQGASLHVVSRGACWLRLDGGATPVELVQGDVVLLPHGTGHAIADHPETPMVELAALAANEGDRAAPYGGDGPMTALVCGAYAFDPGGDHPLLRALPPLMHLPAMERDDALGAAVRLLAGEIERCHPGVEAVVDRLVEVLLVYVLRAWIDRQPADRPGWLGALPDPQIGRALALVHEAPGHRWTVEALGAAVGLSRAAFARRFGDAVGESPIAYLARWRMTVAADLLRGGDEPLAAIAERVGYESEFAFAKAFKRLRGQAPGRYRAGARR